MKKSIAFVSLFFRTLHRDAALDSLRNILAVVGLGTVIGDFATMRYWMVLPSFAIAFLVWYFDYRRHFIGESFEYSCRNDLEKYAASKGIKLTGEAL